MRFNIEDYEGYQKQDIAMLCRDEEEARVFLNYLDSMGKKWCNGESYNEETHWATYGNRTLFYFKLGMYGDCRMIGPSVHVLKFSDFDWCPDVDEAFIPDDDSFGLFMFA